MKKLLLLPIILLAGCSTVLTDRQVEAMYTPTITLNCDTGCSASYTDPRDRPKMPTNGWDVANTAIGATAGVITSTAPWAAIGITAVKGISDAGDRSDNRVDDNSNSSDNSDNRVDDNSNNSDNRTWDTTHEPTIVTQPEPIIMPQPEPIIVNQPEPIIVQPQPQPQ